MPVLHIFNPSHDEALAAGISSYTPSKAAQRQAALLGALPAAWAEVGDVVVLPRGLEPTPAQRRVGAIAWSELAGHLPVAAGIGSTATEASTAKSGISGVTPWGWDAAIAEELRRAGVPPQFLPAKEQLADIRALSSRRTAVGILDELRHAQPDETAGESAWCESEAEVLAAVRSFGGSAFAKAPWSCSGRGVFQISGAELAAPSKGAARVQSILRRQGGIAVERVLRRQQDFAVELDATPAGVRFAGLSVFATNAAGAYLGNLVGADDDLLRFLPAALHAPLRRAISLLEERLTQRLAGRYIGPLGVDMLVARSSADGALRLCPCVEINLRRTMGHAALALRRFLPGKSPAGMPAESPAVCRFDAARFAATGSFADALVPVELPNF